MKASRSLPLLTAVLTLTAVTVSAQQPPAHVASENKAEVPALFAMHEVIYPLWHTAWPNKDVALMRELLPSVKEHAAAIEKAELPGILRDKKEKWDAGVKRLTECVASYEKALADNKQDEALNAVEELHASYEGLVRAIRPAMKELDAYHQVLYRLYHHEWPARQLDAAKASADELVTACATLQAAPLSRRLAGREAELKPAFAVLCEATANLQQVCKGGDATVIGPAVEAVHTAYQKAERLCE